MIEKEQEMWKQGDYFRKINKNVSKYPNMLHAKCRYPVYSLQLKKRLVEQNNPRTQHSQMSNDEEDNENANDQEFSNKRPQGGGDAYTKMVTKVEKIKVCQNNRINYSHFMNQDSICYASTEVFQ